MKKIFLFTILICFSFKQFSQENLEGKILFSEDSKDYPVMGATVKWINTDKGTISNENGDFKLQRDSKTDFATGLGKTIRWFEENWEAIQKDAEFPPGMSSAVKNYVLKQEK